jgi:hypothetical protein
LILAICCTSLLIVGMDVTIVNVALSAIQKDLHAQLAGATADFSMPIRS